VATDAGEATRTALLGEVHRRFDHVSNEAAQEFQADIELERRKASDKGGLGSMVIDRFLSVRFRVLVGLGGGLKSSKGFYFLVQRWWQQVCVCCLRLSLCFTCMCCLGVCVVCGVCVCVCVCVRVVRVVCAK